MGWTKHKAEEEASDKSVGSNDEENMDEDDVVVVHNATATGSSVGTSNGCDQGGGFENFPAELSLGSSSYGNGNGNGNEKRQYN